MTFSISQMRNLGPVMERRLREIGVETADDLRALGSLEAYRRLRFVFGREVSIIALHAMEGALLDCDWRRLPVEVKERLDQAGKVGSDPGAASDG